MNLLLSEPSSIIFLKLILLISLSVSVSKINFVKSDIKSRYQKLSATREKRNIVVQEAIYYSNSLGINGAKLIAKLNSLLETELTNIQKIEALQSRIDINHAYKETIKQEYNVNLAVAERIIADLSKQVAIASIRSRDNNLLRRRRDQSTLTNLRSIFPTPQLNLTKKR